MKMKKYIPLTLIASSLIIPASVFAGTSSKAKDSYRPTAEGAPADRSTFTREAVKDLELIETGALFGTDLFSSEDEKLGDIVDLAFNVRDHHISHLLVMTGGFIDMGGTVRAVPASNVSIRNGRYFLNTTKTDFEKLEPLPDENRVAALSSQWKTSAARQPVETQNTVLFSHLSNCEVEFSEGAVYETVSVTGALVDVSEQVIAFIEVDGAEAISPFDRAELGQRTMIPATLIQNINATTVTMSIDAEEVRDAEEVDSVQHIREVSRDDHEVYTISMN